MEPPYGREWVNLAALSDKDQHLVQWFVARFRDYSPDAKRTVCEWLGKFDLGVIEHGPLQLSSMSPAKNLREELLDATAYLSMIRVQVDDILARYHEMESRAPRLDDPALVARLREFRQTEYDQSENDA